MALGYVWILKQQKDRSEDHSRSPPFLVLDNFAFPLKPRNEAKAEWERGHRMFISPPQ